MIITLIAAAATTCIWALHLRYRKRQMDHQERLTAIEKGIPLPDLSAPAEGDRVYLLRGLLWLFGGMALFVFLLGIAVTTRTPRSLADRIFEAKRLERAGATPEQVQQAINTVEVAEGLPVGVSLLGLVPIAVGAAYLVFYRSERKRQPQ